ncbi:MAG TPA: MASE1 domain-containing protein, partial [Chthonomonadales bacterium]|nr:MASE1 domain-containing protein [Chthonomonadales bacterium]
MVQNGSGSTGQEATARAALGQRRWGTALQITTLCIVYVGAARIGLLMAYTHKNVSPVWPPSGVAMAALLLFGARMWPGVALGALLANFTTGLPLPTALGIAIGNTLEALAAVQIVRLLGDFNPSLARLRDVFRLALAVPVSAVPAATGGVLCLALSGVIGWAAFGPAWRTWWLGDAIGMVVWGP